MKRRDVIATGASLAIASAARGAKTNDTTAPKRNDTDHVKALLDVQAAAWTAGDLELFCDCYHPDALFLSPGGLTKTRQAVYERYKKKYTTKEMMGALTFEILDIFAGPHQAAVALKYRLSYAGREPIEGYSALALLKEGQRWLVKHDASM